NSSYGLLEGGYGWLVRGAVRAWWAMLLVFVVLAAGTGYLYRSLPPGFLPTEDQGYIIIAVQLPDAASLDRTREVEQKLNAAFRETPGVDQWFVLGGFSLLDGTAAPNAATAFIAWKDWKYRTTPELQQEALVARVQKELGSLQEAFVLVLVPPAIQGLGVAGGFQMQIEDRSGVGLGALQEGTQAVVDAANRRPEVKVNPPTFRAGVPQIYLNIDRTKAEKMGVKMSDVFGTLQANLGSVYVNDFNKFGRTWQVRVQASPAFRGGTNVIRRLEVPGREIPATTIGPALGSLGLGGGDQMRLTTRARVPLGTLLSTEVVIGPQSIIRYNLYPTAQLQGAPAPGVSSGESLAVMEEVARQALPSTMGYEWTSLAYQEKRVSGEAVLVFALAVLLVYLVLAAQYESWLLPFAVILVVPLGLLGVVAAVNLRGLDNNIYTQIGIVLIIALASKNAILIVEFARELRIAGRSIREAAVEAARMRFRPIIMTSFAFILGVLPLVFATGAGAASRQSLGTAVCGGMLTATVLAVFFVPVFFVAIQGLAELRYGPPKLHAGEHMPVIESGLTELKPKPVPAADGHGDGVNGPAPGRPEREPATDDRPGEVS
ncbi:MAG TPA: efflux RND transporter permease subunit, partial [Gemmataceae bacterium]|nr:efflux RND transporter permease subunit [Gemmataceae bacterium]